MDLITLKNNYAQEQGYRDWNQLYARAGYYDERVFFMHEDAVIILAQKAALEKAAVSAKVQHYNTRTEKEESASAMGNKGQFYSVDRSSITNEQNLIR